MPTVQSAGVPIYYEMAGVGHPIMLVHGYLSSLTSWQQTGWVEFVVGRGRSVVALDCRGHGRSGKPHDPAAYEDPRMPGDVLAVLDAAALERVDLMGYSMGAAIALSLLARFPERFSSVIAGGVGLPVVPPTPQVAAAIAAAMEADDVSTISEPVPRFFRAFADSRGNDPYRIGDVNADLQAFAAIARRSTSLRSISAADEGALRKNSVPVLVVVGDKDPVLPDAQRLMQTVPHAQLVVVPGDHLSAIPAPAYKEAVASFLTEHSLGAA